MSSVATKVTLEEFLEHDIHYYDFHELHNGEIVVVPAPIGDHVELQERLQHLLRSQLDPAVWFAKSEFYMTLPTEGRRVDVAVVEQRLWQEQRKKTFFGSPKLIAEVLSPSNTHLDVNHLREVTLARDTWQFWVIDMDLEEVAVYKPGRQVALYSPGMDISLTEFQSGAAVPVHAIFGHPRP